MIVRLALLACVVTAPVAFAAGYWQSLHQDAPGLIVTPRINAPIVSKPGFGAAAAAHYFAALNAPPPPPPPPGPPPPPDVAITFRRDVSAVQSQNGTPHIILAGGRILKRGDSYGDGWRLRDIAPTSVVLTKGKETRSVNLFSPPAVTLAATAPTTANFAAISITNGQTPGKLTAGQISRIIDALRALGAGQAQLDQVRRGLEAGTFVGPAGLQQALQLMRGALQGRQLTPAQANSLIQTLVAAGLVSSDQAALLAQALTAGGRGGGRQGGPAAFGPPAAPNAGFAPPQGRGGGRAGFGGGRGGGGGGRRGGLGLNSPAAPVPAGVGDPGVRLAVLAPPSSQDGTRIQ
jgi:hypothetical protein